MAHAFVDDPEAPALSDEDRHHLERVLRVRPGEEVTVSDGAGRRRRCRLGAGGALEPVGDVEVVPRPAPAVAVAFALTKGARPELAVQKLTELGVDRIVPFVAERSVARWEGERAVRHVARLRRVAREAGVQARLAHLPSVAELTGFPSVAGLPGAARCDHGGEPPDLRFPTLLVGPEGGWADAEREIPLPTVALGPTILRAETAAIAAGALLTALRAGVVVERGRSDA
jgi:16S rRNA (uracil1498-N3)-methyltransferase